MDNSRDVLKQLLHMLYERGRENMAQPTTTTAQYDNKNNDRQTIRTIIYFTIVL